MTTAGPTVIDAHLHLWDLAGGGYEWLVGQRDALRRSFGPVEAGRELAAAGVDSAVLVQAEDTVADTRYLLDVAAEHPWVHGVVGWVRLDDPAQAAAQLEESHGAALRGVRHLVHDDPRDDFLDLPGVRTSLGLLADAGLVLDVPDAWPRHLDAVGRVARDHPGLTVVVDHLGKPPRGDAEAWVGWERSLRETAQYPNTVAKLSGLQAPGHPFTAAALRPVLDVALDAYGAERLMWGGDWPMTVEVGGYAAVRAVYEDLIADLSGTERDHLRHATAVRTYGPACDRSHHV